MSEDKNNGQGGLSRRTFIQAGAAAAVLHGGLKAIAQEGQAPAVIKKIEPSDTVNVAYVGVGVRGKQHMRYSGFSHPNDKPADKEATKTLPRPLKLRAVAMCDLYAGNRKWAEAAVPGIKTFTAYEDMLAMKEIDAVFIGTSDCYHAPVGMAAAQAGKHVYCEKPFTHDYAHVKQFRDIVNKTGIIFQLGHQTRSGTMMERAKRALGGIDGDSAIGKITLIETYTNRNNPNGAWVYNIPPDASPATVDWDRYNALTGKKRDFDPDRFFRFRKYWDYGTGQAGDLISHEMDAIQQITGLGIPDTCVANGGVFFYRDGRETPDVFNVAYTYEKEQLALTYTGTLANSKPRERTFFGREGSFDMTGGMKLFMDKNSDRYIEAVEKGEYIIPNAELAAEEENRKKVAGETASTLDWTIDKGIYIEYIDGQKVNVTGLHILNFAECVRAGNRKTNCDINHAFEEGMIVHMANQSYLRGRRVRWDHAKEEIVDDGPAAGGANIASA